MALASTGWLNKDGTEDHSCACLTWQKHWEKHAKKSWPSQCAVAGCQNKPALGAHIFHPNVPGARIVPMCFKCNIRGASFSIKGGFPLVPAVEAETCG